MSIDGLILYLYAGKDAQRLHDVNEWRAIVGVLVKGLLEKDDARYVLFDS